MRAPRGGKPLLDEFDRSGVSAPELARMTGTFNFIVHGYDDDPQEVYAIEEVREYCQAVG